jgi:ribonuclease Z
LLPPWHIEALNPPFGDPGFFLHHDYSGQALMFDLGELHRLPARKLLKVSHIFISHGHIDHLIGFDQLLRITLNRPRHLHFYGPPGIIEMIGHKLQGYHWNLTAHYELLITVHAVHKHELEQRTFICSNKFQPGPVTAGARQDETIFKSTTFAVKAVTLDHGIPCLAFTLNEPLQINFRPDELERRGLKPGPWLSRVRQSLQTAAPDNTIIEIAGKDYTLQEIADAIAIIGPGRKIAYVTDIGFGPTNLKKLLPLIAGANLLLCEAAFLDSAADKAKVSHHLTASQAGEIARQAQVQRLKIFHFSPRHHDLEKDFYSQAQAGFNGPVS